MPTNIQQDEPETPCIVQALQRERIAEAITDSVPMMLDSVIVQTLLSGNDSNSHSDEKETPVMSAVDASQNVELEDDRTPLPQSSCHSHEGAGGTGSK